MVSAAQVLYTAPPVAPVKVEFDRLVIVCLGGFNPQIFHPSWFSGQGLLREEEAAHAASGEFALEVVHPQVVRFALDWLTLEATTERFTVATEQESAAEWARDLFIGTFQLLSHTPTRIVGVNRRYILSYETRDEFDALGWTVVPKANWEPVLELPGMTQVIIQGARPDDENGYIRAILEPVLDGTFRASLVVNDHVVYSDENSSASTRRLCETLASAYWREAGSRARAVLDQVIGLT